MAHYRYMNIPTVHLEWDNETCPPMCRVISNDNVKCLAAFEDDDEAVEWVNNHGYDFSDF